MRPNTIGSAAIKPYASFKNCPAKTSHSSYKLDSSSLSSLFGARKGYVLRQCDAPAKTRLFTLIVFYNTIYVMMNEAIIPGYMTTAQAAEATGLTAHRIGCLARSGEIEAVKSGNTLLIDATSLRSYAQANQGRGRPMDAQTAYGALWTLSGFDASWLTYAQARRLDIRLKNASAESLSWQLRKRAQTRRYRASQSFLETAEEYLTLSGASSSLLGPFGLLQSEGRIEGYIAEGKADDFVASCFLQEDTGGNAIIHIASWLPGELGDEMPLAVVAADLAQSLDTREREAGLDMLGRLLDDYRNA